MAIGTSIAMGVTLATTLATTGASFAQAGKAKKSAKKAMASADAEYEKALARTKVNKYENLSVDADPWNIKDKNLKAGMAEAMTAGVGADQRGVAAVSGQVLAAGNEAGEQLRAGKSAAISEIDRVIAGEASRLADAEASLRLKKAEGDTEFAMKKEAESSAAMQQGISGVTSAIGQVASMPSLYGGGRKTKKAIDKYDVASGGKGGNIMDDEILAGVLDATQWDNYLSFDPSKRNEYAQSVLTPDQWGLMTDQYDARNLKRMQGAAMQGFAGVTY